MIRGVSARAGPSALFRSRRQCGAIASTDGSTRFRVWAPSARRVELVLADNDLPRIREMRRSEDGFHYHVEPDLRDGHLYSFKLDGGRQRADPCSLWQPAGVEGQSAIVRPDLFQWTDVRWRGTPREKLVFYELHVGTFTPEGIFSSIIPRLQSLRELGITAIELMPIGQFPGSRNWGYDGVLPYAAQHSYGGPRGLQALVDACHCEGMAIFLDVVYNHFGPESCYLREFGPYFTDKHKTPWGDAINFDDDGSEPVRQFVLDNARMWLEEFHFDGLRLDAIHAICDNSKVSILRQIKDVADDVQQRTGWPRHIVAESDLNDPRILYSPEVGGFGIDAQWCDDFHHATHALLTGESNAYYSDFGRREHLMRAMNTPFVYAGEFSSHRGRKHGAAPTGLSRDRFVVCLQNHDQIGNRALGDRLSTLLRSPAELRLATCLLLFSPYLPLIFMGEEYGERRPFPFFCSFCDERLVSAIREGRKQEFADFLSNHDQLPDAQSESTFESAKLTWSWPNGSAQEKMRALYADLLSARAQWIALTSSQQCSARLLDGSEPEAVLQLIRGSAANRIRIYFNLTNARQPISESPASYKDLLFTSEAVKYGGSREVSQPVASLFPFECAAFRDR